MAKYQKYAEYQDSGVEALGDIPKNWKVLRGKFLFKEINERSENGEETLLSVSEYYGVKPRGEKIAEGDFITRAESLEGYKKCYINDLVMNIMLAWKRGLGVSKYEGIVSPAYSIFRFNQQVSADYMHYLLRTEEYTKYFKTRSTGIIDSRLRLYPEAFGDIGILLPDLADQTQIANFLDHETAQIDSLIAKQEKLIELLKEKRQAVISHAVTKGLNPDVAMKDSGVEWLGQVPEHWVVSLIKYQCKEITDGAHISPDLENGEHYFVSIRDIKEGVINFDDALLTSDKSYQYLVHTGCKPFVGDILFSKDGTIGQTAITPPAIDFVVASSLIIIRPKYSKITSEFLDLLLRSDIVQEQVESFVKGAALRRLSIQNLLKIWGVFPPLDEQRKIVEFVLSQLDKYKDLETKAEKQVELLRERRTALISSAVTGKIDVRHWQNPNKNNEANTELGA